MAELLPGCAFPSVHIVGSFTSKLPSMMKDHHDEDHDDHGDGAAAATAADSRWWWLIEMT